MKLGRARMTGRNYPYMRCGKATEEHNCWPRIGAEYRSSEDPTVPFLSLICQWKEGEDASKTYGDNANKTLRR